MVESTIEKVKVLHGHVSPDTSYLVDDYPYGRRLRCQIRYWVDTAERGAAKGGQRFARQTTNPKVAGDPWNKPHYSTYSGMVVLYLDSNEHVQHWGIDPHHITPEGFARLQLRGVYEQLTDEQRGTYDRWVERAKRGYAEPWQKWTETVFQLAGYITDHGTEPELVDNVWVQDGTRRYLGSDAPYYFASARTLLTTG